MFGIVEKFKWSFLKLWDQNEPYEQNRGSLSWYKSMYNQYWLALGHTSTIVSSTRLHMISPKGPRFAGYLNSMFERLRDFSSEIKHTNLTQEARMKSSLRDLTLSLVWALDRSLAREVQRLTWGSCSLISQDPHNGRQPYVSF